MKRYLFIFLLFACSENPTDVKYVEVAPIDSSIAPFGLWQADKSNHLYLEFQVDNILFIHNMAQEFSWSGFYWIEQSLLVLGEPSCYGPGRYSYYMEDDSTLSLNSVSDYCEGRSEHFSGTWSKRNYLLFEKNINPRPGRNSLRLD